MIHKRFSGVSLLLAVLFLPPLYAADREHPSIGQLETRDYLIIIHSSPDGLLYTLKTHEGEVVGHQLTDQLLATRYPKIHESLQRGIAAPPQATPEAATPAEPQR